MFFFWGEEGGWGRRTNERPGTDHVTSGPGDFSDLRPKKLDVVGPVDNRPSTN